MYCAWCLGCKTWMECNDAWPYIFSLGLPQRDAMLCTAVQFIMLYVLLLLIVRSRKPTLSLYLITFGLAHSSSTS